MKGPANAQACSRANRWRTLWSLCAAITFFVVVFFYVWLRIEPAVEFQHSAPPFRWGRPFLKPFLTCPGGVVDYGAACLAQFNRLNWLGACAFAGLGSLIFLASRQLLRQTNGVVPFFAPFLPPLLLLLLLNCAGGLALTIGLGWLLGVGAASGYAALPRGQSWLRLVACWLTSALLFHVAGLWPCLLFAVSCGLIEIVRLNRWPLGWGCLASLLIVPPWMLCLGIAHPAATSHYRGAGMSWILTGAMFLFLPLVVVSSALWPGAAASPATSPSQRRKSQDARRARRFLDRARLRRIWVGGLLLLAVTSVWFTFDGTRKAQAEIDYYSSRKVYAKVLTAARHLGTLDVSSELRLHQALYHTGRLLQDLFSFTNQATWTVIPDLDYGLEGCRAQSQTLFELGQVNLAERFAHEALECDGDRPEILRLLARIQILKKRPKAARIFLNALRQVPSQQRSAAACLARLESDLDLLDDQELRTIRSRMVVSDLVHTRVPIESALQQLLEANPRNQMAFEYLVAHYLLTGQLARVAEAIDRLRDFGYASIPRHCEEALLVHLQAGSGGGAALGERPIRPETMWRFEQFREAVNRRVHETAEGRQALARSHGDTFWYHHLVRGARTAQTSFRATEQ